MKAIVQTGPQEIAIAEREPPTIGAHEVLVAVDTAGICGSDAHAYQYDGGYEWIQLPRIMGHEYSGEVVAVGDDVVGVHEGDAVIEEPIHDCGDCFQCKNGQSNVCQNFSITGMHRDGAYAEYVAVDPAYLHAVPNGVGLDHAAITEPTSIATRAVFEQSNTTPGDTVLIQGPGPIGVLVAAVADSLGASVVVSGLDQDTTYRLPLLESMDITTVRAPNLDEITASVTDGLGFDVVFDTTGHHSGINSALQVVRKGGQVVVVGIPNESSELTFTDTVRGEVELNTSYGSTWRNFEQALRLMERGEIAVDTLLDRSFTVSAPEEAFEAFLAAETCKPVFEFGT